MMKDFSAKVYCVIWRPCVTPKIEMSTPEQEAETSQHNNGNSSNDVHKPESSHNIDEDEFHHTNSKSKASHPSRSRRKISMPWFRQSSFWMSFARLRLTKQHTIATENLEDEKKPKSDECDAVVVAAVSRSLLTSLRF